MEAKFSPKALFVSLTCLIVSSIAFVLWFYSTALLTTYDKYRIIFPNSVSGLYEGSIVTYHGVQVGRIESMEIDQQADNKVAVMALVDSKIQPKEDTFATLNMKGITGYMNVELIGGSTNARKLEKIKGEYVIPYQESMLESLKNAAPRIVHRIEHLVNRLDQTFKSIDSPVVSTLKELQVSLPKLVGNFSKALDEVASLVKTQSNNMQPLVPKVQTMVEQLNDFSTKLNQKGILGVLNSSASL